MGDISCCLGIFIVLSLEADSESGDVLFGEEVCDIIGDAGRAETPGEEASHLLVFGDGCFQVFADEMVEFIDDHIQGAFVLLFETGAVGPVGVDRFAPVEVILQIVCGKEFVDANDRAHVLRDISEEEIGGEGIQGRGLRDGPCGKKRFQFAAKNEKMGIVVPVKGFFSNPVAAKKDPSLSLVKDKQGKFSEDAIENGGIPFFISIDNKFCGIFSSEVVSSIREVAAELFIVGHDPVDCRKHGPFFIGRDFSSGDADLDVFVDVDVRFWLFAPVLEGREHSRDHVIHLKNVRIGDACDSFHW